MTKARVYCPAKTAMQSGRAKTQKWVVDLSDIQAQYEEPLMGWTGTSHPSPNTRLFFATQEEALSYLTRYNIDYVFENPHAEKISPKKYGAHFGPERLL